MEYARTLGVPIIGQRGRFLARVRASFRLRIAWFVLAFAVPGLALAQSTILFIEADIRADHEDYLTIYRNGNWAYESDGGSRAGVGLLLHTSGRGFEELSGTNTYTTFPDPQWLDYSLENWEAEVISGVAPRCPPVGVGSNPDSTVSVVEHTDEYVRVALFDFGDCGAGGRVDFRLALSYTLTAGYALANFVEARVLTDHEDYLTILSNGDWQYETVGGHWAGLDEGAFTSGLAYEHMTNTAAFPSPTQLGNALGGWRADPIAGAQPRCPPVGAGGTPESTLSVVEHTVDRMRLALYDSGDCGAAGRVDFVLRISYVTVPATPRILVPPASLTVLAGERAQLSVVADGNNYTFQWRKDGKTFPPIGGPRLASSAAPASGNGRYEVIDSGGSSSVLIIDPVLAEDAGRYDVVVFNSNVRAVSSTADLTVITPDPSVRLDAVRAGGNLVLRWLAAPEFTYQLMSSSDLRSWSRVGDPVLARSGWREVQVPLDGSGRFYRLEVRD